MFRHEHKQISTLIRGTILFSVGDFKELVWMRQEMEKRFLLKSKMIGERECLEKKIKVLNRVIRWSSRGISYEADVEHIPEMVTALNLEHCKPLTAPGSKQEDNLDGESEMCPGAATQYRAATAKCKYLAVDRPDIQYATKKCSKKNIK